MDQAKYSTLYAALQAVPDPRHARGQRHAWSLLLTLIAAALASGQQHVWGIAHWAALHATEIISLLSLDGVDWPSVSTLYRAVQAVDVAALHEQLAAYSATLTSETTPTTRLRLLTGETVEGQAVDGKAVRGASAYGEAVRLVSVVRHGEGTTLTQIRVESRRGEQTATPPLLAKRDLQGTVLTFDAGLAQRALAQQIYDQHGHYLMVVKRNQRDLYNTLALWFDPPPALAWQPCDGVVPVRRCQTTGKGHGRIEIRRLESRADFIAELDWPGVGQVLRRTCRRTQLKTGLTSVETTYGITSLGWHQADVAQLEQVWRGHWTIENRSHYVRDETMGEDRGRAHRGHTPEALATLRNALITTFRARGWTNIAAALRHYGASVANVFVLLGATTPRL
jgi:predicted transposase YbfD/YdcC